MKDAINFLATAFCIVVIPLAMAYWWMASSCAQRGVMEGYTSTKVVATKCYGSNNRKDWYKIWY